MSTRKRSMRVAGALLALLGAGLGCEQEVAAQQPATTSAPSEPPASQTQRPASETQPPTARPAPGPRAAPASPRPFRPSEEISPGRKVSFPNDI
jgi:hypothetical protein